MTITFTKDMRLFTVIVIYIYMLSPEMKVKIFAIDMVAF